MTYADGFYIRSNVANMNLVGNALDGLLGAMPNSFLSTLINTTSTSYADYTGASITFNATASQTAMLVAAMHCSNGTASKHVYGKFLVNGAVINSSSNSFLPTTNATNGLTNCFTLVDFVRLSIAGTTTVSWQWATDSSGTSYSQYLRLAAVLLRTA